MAVRFYDEALLDKIKSWIKDPSLKVLGPEESTRFFQMKADEENDEPLALPLISLSRAADVELDFPHKQPMSFDGQTIEATSTYSYVLNAIPMKLQYQLDIYTRKSDEGDEYLRNFVFNFVNHPKLTIHLPYNDTWIAHDSNIDVASTLTENSDVPLKLFGDQFTRWTITLEVRDAYFFSVPKKDNVQLIVDTLQLDDLKEETEPLDYVYKAGREKSIKNKKINKEN